jgi:hypothetical protein
MLHASPQFTPAQLVEAGRRAEAEGRLDLAVQFYRHLVEHFSEAVEAVEAAEAHGALGRIGTVRPRVAGPGGQRGLWQHADPRRDPYRLGRALTVLFSALGGLVALAGPPALVVCAVVWQERTGLPPLGLVPMAGIAAGLFIAGSGVVLAAGIARALLDQASATRELLALERAKLGLE